MTIITISDDSIIFDGHANDPAVCHGISAISQMAASYMELNGYGNVEIADGHLEMREISDEFKRTDLCCAMMHALIDIADQYPESVMIVSGERKAR